MKDERDDGEDQQQVNQETRDMEEYKAARP
jgi:hypothetical protein